MLRSNSNRNLLHPTIRRGLAVSAVVIGLLRTTLPVQQGASAAGPQPTAPESGYMRVLIRPTHPAVFDAQPRPFIC